MHSAFNTSSKLILLAFDFYDIFGISHQCDVRKYTDTNNNFLIYTERKKKRIF